MSDINEKAADIINLCRSAVYCEKGEFYPDKNFGSRIHEAKDNERLMLSFIRMALSKLDGVYVKNVTYIKNDNLITVDVLINNASVSMDNDIMSKSKDEFLRVVEVNLVGTFLVTREVIKKCNVNTIVNISSTDSTSTYSKLNIDYSCSKAGVNILSKTFSLCYPDIKICTIMPNWVNSETVLSMNSDYLEEEMKRIGQKKLIDKEYVARKTYEVVVDKFIKNGDIIRIDEGEV